MKKLPALISVLIMITAIGSSISSYKSTEYEINKDISRALQLTLAEMPCDIVCPDTIRCYKSHLTITELKDTACIAIRTVCRNDRQETEIVAQANCGFMTIFMLSDQKASGLLLFIGIVWTAGSLWYMRRNRIKLSARGIVYGGLIYDNDTFMTALGHPIYLTPMQHSLLKMFMTADNHRLSKQEICDRLWPKKPDASDTLYTLIRRIKPVIEANSGLRVRSEKGGCYSLTHRE